MVLKQGGESGRMTGRAPLRNGGPSDGSPPMGWPAAAQGSIGTPIMRYFLDTEFNGFGGALISVALVPEHGDDDFYASLPLPDVIEPWVERHVIPYLRHVPPGTDLQLGRVEAADHVAAYLEGDSDPVIIAVGTAGTSAGLAKAVRLRLERLLPQGLGHLAEALYAARAAIKARFPRASDRRRALDGALDEGGALDPFREAGEDAVLQWLEGAEDSTIARHVVTLRSLDPDDLTLREARLLGQADAVIAPAGLPQAILARARADAARLPVGADAQGLVVELRLPD